MQIGRGLILIWEAAATHLLPLPRLLPVSRSCQDVDPLVIHSLIDLQTLPSARPLIRWRHMSESPCPPEAIDTMPCLRAFLAEE